MYAGRDRFGRGRVYDVKIAIYFVKKAVKRRGVSRGGGDATGNGGHGGFRHVADGILSSHLLGLVPVPVLQYR